jgi:hypothetical protein
MTKTEFSILTKKYCKALKKYYNYMEQFTSVEVHGKIVKRATKNFCVSELEEIRKRKNEFENIEKKWHLAVKNEKLIS